MMSLSIVVVLLSASAASASTDVYVPGEYDVGYVRFTISFLLFFFVAF